MDTLFPTDTGYSARFIRGLRGAGPTATEDAGAAIVKRSFTVSAGALIPDAGGEAILEGDDVVIVDDQGNTDPTDDLIRVRRESDLVVRKNHGDVIVLGHHGGDIGGRVEIDSGSGAQTWLTRTAGANNAGDPDTQVNLFGWHPRDAATRLDEARPAFPDFDPASESGNLDHFWNAHRRTGGGFSAFSRTYTSTGTVAIFHQAVDGSKTFGFSYSFPTLTARYFAFCGCGPDREAFWGPVDLGAMTLDTLVIRPDAATVSAVWRISWPWEQVPPDSYRRLEVRED
ncbi:hypothetical protein AB0T83_11805 [Fluviibacterium sp. DFM31]|uniref:Uncharacterized protein n=2 Tax=Meridianimarinicoccus marinus TaxID=3231483 RepID=A0ABV3L7A5_9RHOB